MTLKFEWRDDRRCIALGLIVGAVMAMEDGQKGDFWLAFPGVAVAESGPLVRHATEADARASVEAAVIAAICGASAKWDVRAAPCPTCGFHIRGVKAPPFVFDEEDES